MSHQTRCGLRACACAISVLAALLTSGSALTGAQVGSSSADGTREHAAAVVEAWNRGLPYVPGEVLVKFRAGAEPPARARALSQVMRGGMDEPRMQWVGEVLRATVRAEPNSEALAAVLRRQPEVEWAQPNYFRRLHAVPNDPSFSRQWNFSLINLPRAWDINPGSTSDVKVAVVDTGVTAVTTTRTVRLWTGSGFEHVAIPFRANPDIAASRVLPGRDFTRTFDTVLDLHGHGTHVSGTVLQETNNGFGLSGVAYRAVLLPLKACFGYWDVQILMADLGIPGSADPADDGFCDDAAVAQAIRFAADDGARVINVSLGSSDPSPIQLEAMRYAVQRGAFITLSGGNSFDDGNAVEYPAAYAAQLDGAVAVGAVGRSSRRAYYSNTGAYIELVAPGGDVLDGGLAGMVYQMGLVFDEFVPGEVVRPRFDQYWEEPSMGTSMAAPHVAGVAALLYSQGITSPGAIEAALKQFARDLGAAGRDNEYGYGLVDARATLFGLGVAR